MSSSFDLYFLGDVATVTPARVRAFFEGRAGYAMLDESALHDSEDTGVSFSFSFESVMEESDGGRPVLPLALHVRTLCPSPFGLEAAEEVEALVQAFDVQVWDPQAGTEGPYSSEKFLRSWRAESRKAYDEAAAKDLDFSAHPHMPDDTVKNVWQWNRGHELLLDSLGRQGDGLQVPTVRSIEDLGGTPRAMTAVEWNDAEPIALPEVDVVVLVMADGEKSVIAWQDLDPLIAEWSEEPPHSRYASGDSSRTAGLAHHVLSGDGLREAFDAALAQARDDVPESLEWEQIVVSEPLARSIVRIAAAEIAEGTKRPDFHAELVVEDWNGTHGARVDGRGAVRRGIGDLDESPASIVRQARLIELVRVAGAIVDTGFPDLEVGIVPPGAPGAVIHVRAGAMGHVSEVALTADRLGEVPAMQQLAGTIGGVLGDALPEWPPAPPPIALEPAPPSPIALEPAAPPAPAEPAEPEAPESEEPEPPTVARPMLVEPPSAQPLPEDIEPPTEAAPMRFAPPSDVEITEEPTPEEEPPAMTQRGGTPARATASDGTISDWLEHLDDDRSAMAALRHNGYRLAFANGVPLTLPNEQGEPYGVVVTSDEACEAIMQAWPHLRDTMTLASKSGRELFGHLDELGAAGLLINPCGPGLAILPAEQCRRIADYLPTIRLTYQAGSEHDAAFGFGRTILELLDDGRARIHNIDATRGTRAWETRVTGAPLETLRDVVRRAAAMPPTHLELQALPGDPLRHVELWVGEHPLTVRTKWSDPRPYDELFRWLDSIIAQGCASEDLGFASIVQGLVS